jgi:hypothetical protein
VAAALIIEPLRSGHHLTYLIEIVRGAVERGMSVVVAVGADESGETIAKRLFTEIGPEIAVVRVPMSVDGPPPTGLLRRAVRAYRWWRFLAKAQQLAADIASVEFVFVPYIDFALFAISALGSPFGRIPFGGISMAQSFHFEDMGVEGAAQAGRGLRKRLFFRFLDTPGLKQLYVIDDTLEGFVHRFRPELGERIAFVPDPVSPPQRLTKHEARDALRLSRERPIVLTYGSIDGRKGLDVLLRWLAETTGPSAPAVVLAGTVRSEVRPLLEGESARKLLSDHRLIVLPRYIERHEEPLLFSAADVVWIAYESVASMSGVLVKAAQYEKSVLYRDFGLIGRYAGRFGCPATPAQLGLPLLPDGVRLCAFCRGVAGEPPLDHSWDSACDRIFGERNG